MGHALQHFDALATFPDLRMAWVNDVIFNPNGKSVYVVIGYSVPNKAIPVE